MHFDAALQCDTAVQHGRACGAARAVCITARNVLRCDPRSTDVRSAAFVGPGSAVAGAGGGGRVRPGGGDGMGKGRLEAFSDGVLAIVITIMVLELKVPHGVDWSALAGLVPVFLSYVLSFVYVGIYWNNHHHMLQAVRRVDGLALWANLHLLFWLSLVPFVTGWMGENHFAPLPVALYGVVLIAAAIAYTLLSIALRRTHDDDSAFAHAFGHGGKEAVSMAIYALALVVCAWAAWLSLALYAVVAVIWLVPDRRYARALALMTAADD
jgi:uncharacterized membrane protein